MPVAARGKTICFIDNSNIFLGGKNAGWQVDWQKLESYLSSAEQIWQTHFFASEQDPPKAMQTSFYQYIKNVLRFELHLYELGKKSHTCSNCSTKDISPAEKGVDVGVATKMLILGANKAYETAILVSGDRDYLETVKFIKNLGLRVEIVSWQKSLSGDLAAESSTPVLLLDSLKSQIEKA